MKKLILFACAALIVLASPAAAHVTIQPNEAIIGSFSRFVVRVPNEEPDSPTVKVQVELPPLAFVSFEPKDGWKRTVKMRTLDEPIEAFGQEITEVVGTVTWSGGSIGVGEFDEFGLSANMPAEETSLTFEAVQTYGSGKVVRWVGPPDSGEPAPQLNVFDIGAGEEEGVLATLARLNDEVTSADGGTASESDDQGESEDEDESTLPIVLSGAALVLAALAAGVALTRSSKA